MRYIWRGCAAAAVILATLTSLGCDNTDLDQEAVATNNRGVALMGRFDYEAARAEFDKVVQRYPEQLDVQVNLGIAMETPDGLFVPVLDNITGLDAPSIKAAFDQLKASVVERVIAPHALRGQTITLSNFGSVGGLHADMVVVPPQVAIIGAGRTFERLVMQGQTPTAHRFLPLSITFDHRVVTGVEACEFLQSLIQDLELSN